MAITRLSISYFRNISKADLNPGASVNFLYGCNGSGKTSVLECISVLSLGRSFRSRKHKNLVQFGEPKYSLYADTKGPTQPEAGFASTSIGVERGVEGAAAKSLIDGSKVSSSSSLAEALPIQWIDSNTFQLLNGGPSTRRAYIDWAVFHVKHSFQHSWALYQSCLKQRNSMLKRGKMDGYDLRYWDEQLSTTGEAVNTARATVVRELTSSLNDYLCDFDFFDSYGPLSLVFDSGWPSDLSLAESLVKKREQDSRYGFTTTGPHKAELDISIGGRPVSEVFSRGQQKAFVSMLKFAQVAYVQSKSGKPVVLLIDDLTAELDGSLQKLVASWVDNLGIQCFVTGISIQDLTSAWSDKQKQQAKVFHVKHGEITEEFLNGEVNDR